MNIRFVPRKRDNELLGWLRDRSSGVLPGQIAKAHGCVSETVTITLKKIMQADIAESGEDPEIVRSAYW